jgi:hypothetical protein
MDNTPIVEILRMSDENKKIDETLQELGFSIMSEEEQKALDSKLKPKEKKPPKRKGLSDAEIASLSARVKLLLDELPHPMDSDLWTTEVNELQAQFRSCLNNEIFDRYMDVKRNKLFKVFMRGLEDEDEQMALMFPIALALVVYNAFYDPTAIKPTDIEYKPDLLGGEAFKKQAFFELVEQVIEPEKFFCDNVHPHVVEFMDTVNIGQVESLVTPEQVALAEVLAREVLIRVYAESLAFLFRPRTTNGSIMNMLSTVIILAFAGNKYVTSAMHDML